MSAVTFARWFLTATFFAATAHAQASEAAPCPVTEPSLDEWTYGNDALQVGLPPAGTFTFEPRGAGFVAVSDGALGIKVGWNRLIPGHLRIEGRRLDAVAPPLRFHAPPYGDIGFQASSVIFPTPGCWEVTGSIGDASLTFVVLVQKIGDGPSGRRDL
jgi:hypothetical protein